MASADLMCEAVAGRPGAAVRAWRRRSKRWPGRASADDGDAAMRALRPLSAVHEFPSRVKCVTLPWRRWSRRWTAEGGHSE